MINQVQKNQKKRVKRALRVRKKLHGTSQKPRLCVVKSNKHLHAQLIDDDAGHTIAFVATFSKDLRTTEFNRKNKGSATKLGEQMAEMAKSKNIKEVVFDRGPFKYHGNLAQFADAVRASGLQF